LNCTNGTLHSEQMGMYTNLKDLRSIKGLVLGSGINVPQANLGIIRTTKQITFFKLTPRQTIAFSVVTPQSQIRGACTIKRRLRWVLAIVKDINLSTNSLGSYHKWVLWHIPCPIHLPIMIYLLNYLHLQN